MVEQITPAPIANSKIELFGRVEATNEYPILHQIRVDDGQIEIPPSRESKLDLSRQQTLYLALAAIGIRSNAIGTMHGQTYRQVQTELVPIYKQLKITRHLQIGKTLLERGHWRVTSPCSPLNLSSVQLPIVEMIADGMTDIEIANALHYSPSNVHQHVVRIGHRTGWKGRGMIALAAMTSGEIGNILLP